MIVSGSLYSCKIVVLYVLVACTSRTCFTAIEQCVHAVFLTLFRIFAYMHFEWKLFIVEFVMDGNICLVRESGRQMRKLACSLHLSLQLTFTRPCGQA